MDCCSGVSRKQFASEVPVTHANSVNVLPQVVYARMAAVSHRILTLMQTNTLLSDIIQSIFLQPTYNKYCLASSDASSLIAGKRLRLRRAQILRSPSYFL
jgi:hypothetical protein